ncbi:MULTISPECIES: hypothetical protein [Enterobacterales]|uniref:hypothetical protein n=1 Tax=Enterobacterales TaxID=91347 RepID=UPI002EDA3974
MKKNILLVFFLLLAFTVKASECKKSSEECMNTILGPLDKITESEAKDGYSHLLLNGKEIYKANDDYIVIGNDDGVFKNKKYLITKAIISYTSNDRCVPDTTGARCAMNVVLDLTSGKPVISNPFFSGWGDSTITWVSWGKANAIIVIDNNLRFKYANGHVEKVTKEKDAAGENDAKK